MRSLFRRELHCGGLGTPSDETYRQIYWHHPVDGSAPMHVTELRFCKLCAKKMCVIYQNAIYKKKKTHDEYMVTVWSINVAKK